MTALTIHKKDEQSVLYQPDNPEPALDHAAKTMLTEFFQLNKEDPEANQYLYSDIPEHYWWDTGSKKWKKRKRSNPSETPVNIGRVHNVHPTQDEFYLRLLLHHIPGPKCFEGKICDTKLYTVIAGYKKHSKTSYSLVCLYISCSFQWSMIQHLNTVDPAQCYFKDTFYERFL